MPYARLFGALAMAAGFVRIVLGFFPWSDTDPLLQGVAFAIDLGFLFGLTGFWVANAKAFGAPGLVTYLVAASGLALIVGPDGTAFGVDIYLVGVHVIGIGLVLMSIVILIRRIPARMAAAAWLLSAVANTAGLAMNRPEGFLVAGILFAAGFVFAGWTLLRTPV
jgi:hypothetical protein